MGHASVGSVWISRARAFGTAVAVSGLGVAGLAFTPSANASCASFFGIGNSANCTSTLTSIAIAIGTDAEAHADGVLGAALSFGNSAVATTSGVGNIAFTSGGNTRFNASGFLTAAIGLNAGGYATVAVGGPTSALNLAVAVGSTIDNLHSTTSGIGNLFVSVASGGYLDAGGNGSVTVAAFSKEMDITNSANLSNVTTLGSVLSQIETSGTGTWAFDVLGNENHVGAVGPLAVAGTVFPVSHTVAQFGPGLNIQLNPPTSTGAAAMSRKSRPLAAAASNNFSDRADPSAGKASGTKSSGISKPRSRR